MIPSASLLLIVVFPPPTPPPPHIEGEQGKAAPLHNPLNSKVVKEGQDFDKNPPPKHSWAYVQDALAKGGTWVWMKTQNWHGTLYNFCSELEQSLNGMWVGTNVYITPAGSRGNAVSPPPQATLRPNDPLPAAVAFLISLPRWNTRICFRPNRCYTIRI